MVLDIPAYPAQVIDFSNITPEKGFNPTTLPTETARGALFAPLSPTCSQQSIAVVTGDVLYPRPIVSDYYNLYKDGARAANAAVEFRGYGVGDGATGYLGANSSIASAEIARACAVADALVVEVDFPSGSPGYVEMDKAINDCLDKDPEFPIFSTISDNYHNDRLYAYIGPEDYLQGEACARGLLFTSPFDFTSKKEGMDALSGRGSPPSEPIQNFARRCPDNVCTVLSEEQLRASRGGRAQLLAGLEDYLARHNASVKYISPNQTEMAQLYTPGRTTIDPFKPGGELTSRDTQTATALRCFSKLTLPCWTGAAAMERWAPPHDAFLIVVDSFMRGWRTNSKTLYCGFSLFGHTEDEWQIGADPFREGMTAVDSAAAAARLRSQGGQWLSSKGNSMAQSQVLSSSQIGLGPSRGGAERRTLGAWGAILAYYEESAYDHFMADNGFTNKRVVLAKRRARGLLSPGSSAPTWLGSEDSVVLFTDETTGYCLLSFRGSDDKINDLWNDITRGYADDGVLVRRKPEVAQICESMSASAALDFYSENCNASCAPHAPEAILAGICGTDLTSEYEVLGDFANAAYDFGGSELKISLGVSYEWNHLFHEMHSAFQKDGRPWGVLTDECTGYLDVSGHSLGGALAYVFAALANEAGQTEPVFGRYVDKVHGFAAIPAAGTSLRNGQSEDGCFAGGMYYTEACAKASTNSLWCTEFVDFAVTLNL